jgi:hypothetical protein
MEICKYCNSRMMQQDTDPLPGGYATLFVCLEKGCNAVYERWYDKRNKRLPERDRWFNPSTGEFEK